MKSNAMEAGLAACHGDGAAYPVEGRIAARRGRIRSRTGEPRAGIKSFIFS